MLELDLEGEERPFYLIVDKGQISVKEGVDNPVDMVISGNNEAFVDVITGRKDVTYAVAHGELKLAKEKIQDIIALSRILRTTGRRK